MTTSFGGGQDRWEAMHSTITQVVSELDSSVRFGLTTYTSRDGDLNPPCPRLPTQVDFDLYNSGTIGDGKSFVVPLERCVRIRTGEEGSEAIG